MEAGYLGFAQVIGRSFAELCTGRHGKVFIILRREGNAVLLCEFLRTASPFSANALQSGTPKKSLLADHGHAFGDRNAPQCLAVAEGTVFYDPYALADEDRFDFLKAFPNFLGSFSPVCRLRRKQKRTKLVNGAFSNTGRHRHVRFRALIDGERYRTVAAFLIRPKLSHVFGVISDIRNMDEETAKLLKNKALIAISQDEDTRPPLFVSENTGQKEALLTFRHLSGGKVALGFFNPYETEKTFMIPYYEIGLDPLCGWGFDMTDAFTGEHLGVCKEYVQVSVPAGDCRVMTGTLVKVK